MPNSTALITAAVLVFVVFGMVFISGNYKTGFIVSGAEIAENSISNRHIMDYAVEGRNIRDYTITAIKIADNAVTNAKILTLDTSKLQGSINVNLIPSLSANKINSGTFPSDRIADSAITNTKLANDAVTYRKIADRAVTPNKLQKRYYIQTIFASPAGDSFTSLIPATMTPPMGCVCSLYIRSSMPDSSRSCNCAVDGQTIYIKIVGGSYTGSIDCILIEK